MTGVEILAVEEVVVGSEFNLEMFLVISFLFLVIGSVLTFLFADTFEKIITILSVSTVLGAIVGLMYGYDNSIPTEYANQYKVTISDEVSMNEFLEKYEIINQEGKIFTVREVEADEDLD